ncbi:hypothetical protein C1X59_16710 [Pseudomonas sp. FW215-R2]|uniref:hypothetical protein n=1 Tax=unclassified Pseudomonas TaxID=196821 RepID=UPI000C885546|nr:MULTISPECIES: hypothetical protein [unclassified Pseudomonas]PMW99468.1 hypothetical protein C1X59_16710 [Pseudomonas sp. FW215-R2]PMX06123.1 hypothetical protein C1X60_25870 [Pseudomonas sp. FW215-L1]PMX19507.1 hypothetical protein C1X57_24915 [Pseudomonas sp. FW215-E1]PNA24711.1 hypothetical protein C1X58_23230 [Pseudomonas sp. FW215-R4]
MNSPFVVYPAKVVGGIQSPIYYPNPAVKPHYGAPLALFTAPGDLLRLEIIPWDAQAINDSAYLIINNGTPRFMKTIGTGDVGKSFDYSVSKALFSDGINTLVVRVTNTVQPGGTDSVDLITLVHIPRPGGEVVGSGPNPNLTFTVSHMSVGPTEAANGVDVRMRYTHMRIGDNVTLYLDGGLKTQRVTATDLQLGYVQIKLFAPDFPQDNSKFELRYRVETSLGDSSGPQAIWSAPTYIDVHVKQPVLDLLKPTVLEAKEADGRLLNFEKDFYQNTHATVEVQYTGSNTGQKVRVYCIGRAETYGSETQTVSAPGQTLTFLIPRRVIVDSIANKIEFSYTVILPNTVKELPSKDLDVNITRQKHLCGVPTINTARNNLRLYAPNPLEAPYTARISLTIDGQTRLDSNEIPYVQGPYMDFSIPTGWVSSNPGKTGYFNYSIRRTGSTDPIIFSPYLKVLL